LIDRLPVAEACGSDWAFIPEPAAAPGQTLIAPQPGTASCTPGGIAYAAIDATLVDQDFTALVFGDCTGNWRPATAAVRRGAAAGAVPATAHLRRQGGGRLTLSIGVEGDGHVSALEARVNYDPRAL